MGYVIAAIIVLLLVAGFVTFLVMNSMRKGAGRRSADRSAAQSGQGGPPGIGSDPTPLGDTSEHAGEQSAAGETVGDPEHRDREVGVDPAQPSRPEDRQLRDAGAETARGPASGTPDTRPESERLANRPR
jgi:hypothetical protein